MPTNSARLPTYARLLRAGSANSNSNSNLYRGSHKVNTRSRYNIVLHAGGGTEAPCPVAPDIAFACQVEGQQPAIITAQEIDSARKITARNSVYRFNDRYLSKKEAEEGGSGAKKGERSNFYTGSHKKRFFPSLFFHFSLYLSFFFSRARRIVKIY